MVIEKTPVAILVRVSTLRQETDRQMNELESYAASNGYEVVAVLKETISGKANADQREGLVKQLKQGQSIRNTAKITGHAVSTIQRIKHVWYTSTSTRNALVTA